MKIVQVDDVAAEAVSHNPEILKRVLLSGRDLPGSVRLSHAMFAPGQKAAAHRHKNICEVFYILSGHGLMTIDGAACPLEQGSCIMIEAGELHELANTGKTDLAVIYFGLSR